jgi:hypothetical protein
MQGYRNVVVLALIIALPLAGCAAIQRSEARDKEQLLAAAGFQAKPADTPEKLANLKAMPPRQLVARSKDGILSIPMPTPTTATAYTWAVRKSIQRTSASP